MLASSTTSRTSKKAAFKTRAQAQGPRPVVKSMATFPATPEKTIKVQVRNATVTHRTEHAVDVFEARLRGECAAWPFRKEAFRGSDYSFSGYIDSALSLHTQQNMLLLFLRDVTERGQVRHHAFRAGSAYPHHT